MIYAIIFAAVFAVDIIIKIIADKKLAFGKNIPVLKNKIILNKLYNNGAMMSIMKDKPRLLYFVSGSGLALTTALLVHLIKNRPEKESVVSFTFKLGLTFIIAGGLNNFADRIKNGHVTDYFSFNFKRPKFLKHIVFNISDMFIFAGSAFSTISSLFSK